MGSGGSSSLPFPPPGFRFEPTERELVGYFLANRINGGYPVFEEMIKECDPYEEEPCKTWEKFHDPASLGRYLYLFTELRKMSPNSKNFCRNIRSSDEKSTSTSTWHEQNKSTRLIRVDGMVAERKAFTYRSSNNSDRSVSWILHEYKFHFSNIVLCRLRRNELQPPNVDAEVREFEADRNPPSKKRRRLDFDSSATDAANSDSDSSKIVHQAKRLRREKSSSLPIHCSNGTGPTRVPEFNIASSACLGIDVPAVEVVSSSMGTIAYEHAEASAPSSSGAASFKSNTEQC